MLAYSNFVYQERSNLFVCPINLVDFAVTVVED